VGLVAWGLELGLELELGAWAFGRGASGLVAGLGLSSVAFLPRSMALTRVSSTVFRSLLSPSNRLHSFVLVRSYGQSTARSGQPD
jgi:hypothetical protein